MHLHAFSCLQLQKDPAQLRQLRGVVGRAAHLRRQLVDGLCRDGAVLVAHLGVLLLLEDVHRLDLVHGLAARDDDCVEFVQALSPLGFSLVYVCVVHESVRILTHVGVFFCIHTHHEAVMKQVSCYHLIIAWRIQIRHVPPS